MFKKIKEYWGKFKGLWKEEWPKKVFFSFIVAFVCGFIMSNFIIPDVVEKDGQLYGFIGFLSIAGVYLTRGFALFIKNKVVEVHEEALTQKK